MKHVRRFAAAMAFCGLVTLGIAMTPARVEAAKDKGGDSQGAMCAYLYSVMTYPYVSPTIQQYAASLFVSYGCTLP